MMQMLGRAGRPQFDDSATAVILTRKERVAHYESFWWWLGGKAGWFQLQV
jgi:ATP-dependent DNA helicase HFM1/MER3